MATQKIEKLSYAELVDLKARIETTIDIRRTEEKAKVREEVARLVAEAGFKLDEVVSTGKGNSSTAGKRGAVAPKYRNPANPTDIWTGRGRKPRWLVAELEAGRDQDDFLID